MHARERDKEVSTLIHPPPFIFFPFLDDLRGVLRRSCVDDQNAQRAQPPQDRTYPALL
jgi:hypothetical protein